jgi:hypothetical protein
VIPEAEDMGKSLWDNFEEIHPSLVDALVTACNEFDKQLRSVFGVVDSQQELRSTPSIHPYNMWIGNPEFYFEWIMILRPVLAKLDELREHLPKNGYQARWAGFIAERLFTVYINRCRRVNRWTFVERPVIYFEDHKQIELNIAEFNLSAARETLNNTLIERDVAINERDVAINERDVAINERDVAINERDVAINERDVAIKNLLIIEHSKAWRATKPIRKTVSLLKRLQ